MVTRPQRVNIVGSMRLGPTACNFVEDPQSIKGTIVLTLSSRLEGNSAKMYGMYVTVRAILYW